MADGYMNPRRAPGVFGLTKTLGGYHYRQSRNDNSPPQGSHQPKKEIEIMKRLIKTNAGECGRTPSLRQKGG